MLCNQPRRFLQPRSAAWLTILPGWFRRLTLAQLLRGFAEAEERRAVRTFSAYRIAARDVSKTGLEDRKLLVASSRVIVSTSYFRPSSHTNTSYLHYTLYAVVLLHLSVRVCCPAFVRIDYSGLGLIFWLSVLSLQAAVLVTYPFKSRPRTSPPSLRSSPSTTARDIPAGLI